MLDGKALERVIHSAGVLGRRDRQRLSVYPVETPTEQGAICDRAIRHARVTDFDVEPRVVTEVAEAYETAALPPPWRVRSRLDAAARGAWLLRAYERRFLVNEPLGMEDAAPRLIHDVLARCAQEQEQTNTPTTYPSVHPEAILARVGRLQGAE